MYLKSWRDHSVRELGTFDGVVCVGAFEHFCSVEDQLDGRQEQVYRDFFELCNDLLLPGGRIFLQTMMWGSNTPNYDEISLDAPKGSDPYILAVLEKFYPGSWLPDGLEQIKKCAAPRFQNISLNNGRLDYIETMNRWGRTWKFTLPKAWAVLKLTPKFLTNRDFRYQLESLRGGYNKECFIREIMDHERMVFEKVLHL